MISKQRQIDELLRCGKDPLYFINAWAKIQHPTKGLISFKTFDFQGDCVRAFEKFDYNIVVKARQLGLSTVTAAYALWMALFRKDKNILVLATKLKTAQGFLKKVKTILSNLPSWLRLTNVEAINKTEVEFDNGSIITAIATGEDAARGEALSLLIVDEAAIIRDLDELWAGLFPTVSEGGKVIMISTPFGVGGFYHKTWIEAAAGLNEFNPIKLPWELHPDRDNIWFAKITRNMTTKKVSQEYLCNFLTSGETFINNDDIDYIRDSISTPIIKEGPLECVWIWRPPEQDSKYVMSADVARGDANDFSTFHIINASTCEVVCEFKGLIPPDKFALLMMSYGKKYNTAMLCPENNSFGYLTAIELQNAEYTNLYYEKTRTDIYSKSKKGAIPGFSTQAKSRLQILSKFEEMIRNKVVKIHSERFYDEVCTFSWIGGKAQAMKGSHDDLIMSLAIGLWIMDVVIPETNDAQELSKAVLTSISADRGTYEKIQNALAGATPLVNPSVQSKNLMFSNSQRPSLIEDGRRPIKNSDGTIKQRTEYDWLLD